MEPDAQGDKSRMYDDIGYFVTQLAHATTPEEARHRLSQIRVLAGAMIQTIDRTYLIHSGKL